MGFERPQTLASPTGAALSYSHQPAEGRVRGVVQVLHGLAEHSGRYDRFAAFLAGRGYHVYAHDHRGHGYTRAPDAPFTVFAARDGADKVVADVAAVRNVIVTEQPGLPVILFGHSMGGLVALNCLKAFPRHIYAAAIWNAPMPGALLDRLSRLALGWERFRRGSDMPSALMRRFTFGTWARGIPGRRTDFDWLSRDPREVDDYIADPLCGWDPSVSMWGDVLDLMVRAWQEKRYSAVPKELPIHLVGGGADPVTRGGRDVGRLASRLRALGFSNLVSTIYPDTRHESLNEVNRNIIQEEFAAWADKVVARASRWRPYD
jgi:alpha-beta hydrolase superfamily lysophospholipase